MSLLDQPQWAVTADLWFNHRDRHQIMPDPTCDFCPDEPTYAVWRNEMNRHIICKGD